MSLSVEPVTLDFLQLPNINTGALNICGSVGEAAAQQRLDFSQPYCSESLPNTKLKAGP